MNREQRCVVKLKNVCSYLHRSINLVGIVVEFSIPRKSTGTDCCTILKIIDQSQHEPELCINIFMKDIDALPCIRGHKDIILLCNVKIESYLGTPSAVFYERASSFALFGGRVSDDFNPFQISPKFQSLDCDKDLVRRLRNWSQLSSFDAETTEYEQQNYSLEEIESMALPRNVGFPHLGTPLRVIVDQAYGNLRDNIRNFRGWVRIRNLQINIESGLWKGILTASTKIRLLCKDHNSVTERLRDYNERIYLKTK